MSPNPSVILCFPEEFKQISWPKKSVISSQTPLSCRFVQVQMTFGGILVFLELHWTYFTPFPSASIVDFEQVNASWVLTIFHFSRNSKTCVKIKRINHLLITLRLAKNVQQGDSSTQVWVWKWTHFFFSTLSIWHVACRYFSRMQIKTLD